MKKDPVPEGWQKQRGSVNPQFRYLLEGQDRYLVILQFSPRRWHYGDGEFGVKRGWVSRGKANSRAEAIALAHAYEQNRQR